MLLVLVMVVSVFTGCNSSDNGSSNSGDSSSSNDDTKQEEPITLTVYSQLANYSGELTGWLAQEFLERFNVKMLIVPDTDGVYDTRMEAGNLGDIVIWGNDGDDYIGAVEAGLLFDWNEDGLLDEYGADIKATMQDALQKNMDISGGTLYGFGHNVATTSEDHEAFFYTWDVRWDLYQQLGYPEVKDMDDYLDLMIKMKEINPTDDVGNETYAVSLWPDWDGAMVMYVKSFATAYFGHDELGIGHYDVETGEFLEPLAEGSPYLQSLKFFNDLYQNNLLDPDSMTQTFDEMTAKVQNGGTFFSVFNFSGNIPFNTDTHLAENKIMLSLIPEDAHSLAYGMNIKGGNRVWSIGAKSQYPELCMEIINWLATPEGKMVSEYGPQGVTWDYDENGYTVATELGKLMHYDQETEFPADSGYYGKFSDGGNKLNNTTWSIDASNPDSNGETYNWDTWGSNAMDARNDAEADWREKMGVDTVEAYMEGTDYKLAKAHSYSESPRSDELKVVWEQVIKSIVDYSWNAIYASSDEEFDEIVAELVQVAGDYGYDQCVEWSKNEAALRKSLEIQ